VTCDGRDSEIRPNAVAEVKLAPDGAYQRYRRDYLTFSLVSAQLQLTSDSDVGDVQPRC
jgi:hypothetical protein